MKVAFLVTDDWFFWSHRRGLACAVRDAGCDVVVCTSDGTLRSRIEAEGFEFEPVRFDRSVGGQVRNLLLLRKLVHIYRRHRPDLVHHVSFLPIVYGSLAARLAGVPCVVNAVTGLGHAFISERRSLLRWLVERGYELSLSGSRVHTILQNPDDARLFFGRGLVEPERASVVYGSGVDTNRFRPEPERDGVPVILQCSRMLWSKGVGDLVEAGRRLRAEGVEHEIHLVGEPHPTNPDSIPEQVLRQWDRAGDVRWCGYREDVPELMWDAHVVCLPSYYREGVPLALIEGAACSRPLVTTDSPGCREIVSQDENGLLVPRRDPVALARALRRLVRDAPLRRAMGERGAALVRDRFSMDVVNGAILTLYGELLGDAWSPEGPRREVPEPVLLESAAPGGARRWG